MRGEIEKEKKGGDGSTDYTDLHRFFLMPEDAAHVLHRSHVSMGSTRFATPQASDGASARGELMMGGRSWLAVVRFSGVGG